MPVSGLVVSLVPDPSQRRDALAKIAAHARIEVGQDDGHCVAIVTDTPSAQADKALWDWIYQIPGVIHLEVAFVGFDEDVDESTQSQTNQPSCQQGISDQEMSIDN